MWWGSADLGYEIGDPKIRDKSSRRKTPARSERSQLPREIRDPEKTYPGSATLGRDRVSILWRTIIIYLRVWPSSDVVQIWTLQGIFGHSPHIADSAWTKQLNHWSTRYWCIKKIRTIVAHRPSIEKKFMDIELQVQLLTTFAHFLKNTSSCYNCTRFFSHLLQEKKKTGTEPPSTFLCALARAKQLWNSTNGNKKKLPVLVGPVPPTNLYGSVIVLYGLSSIHWSRRHTHLDLGTHIRYLPFCGCSDGSHTTDLLPRLLGLRR